MDFWTVENLKLKLSIIMVTECELSDRLIVYSCFFCQVKSSMFDIVH